MYVSIYLQLYTCIQTYYIYVYLSLPVFVFLKWGGQTNTHTDYLNCNIRNVYNGCLTACPTYEDIDINVAVDADLYT